MLYVGGPSPSEKCQFRASTAFLAMCSAFLSIIANSTVYVYRDTEPRVVLIITLQHPFLNSTMATRRAYRLALTQSGEHEVFRAEKILRM